MKLTLEKFWLFALTLCVLILFSTSGGVGIGGFGGGGNSSSLGSGGFQGVEVNKGGSGDGTIATTTLNIGDSATSTTAGCINMTSLSGASTSMHIQSTTTGAFGNGGWELFIRNGNCKL